MRLTFLSLIVLALCATSAEARPKTAADDALVERFLAHADKLSAILEKDLDRPRPALAAVDRYLKKHRKKLEKMVGELVTVAGELDDDARAELATQVLWGERSLRLMKAVGAFRDAHGDDPAHAKKIDALLDELITKGKRLFDALR